MIRESFRKDLFFEWILYCTVLIILACWLSPMTVGMFILCTFFLSLRNPVFAITSFQCSLIANKFFEQYYLLNIILSAIIVVACLIRISNLRYISRTNIQFSFLFIYSLLMSIINKFDNILVVGTFLLMIILTRMLMDKNYITIKELIISMLIVSCFSGIVGLVRNSYGLSYGVGSVNRFLSSYGDPNFFCMISIAAIVGLAYFPKSKMKIFTMFIVMIFCTLTFSKSMLVLVAVNLLIFLFKAKISLKKKLRWVAVMIIGLLMLNWIVYNLYDQNIIWNYIFRFTQESSGSSDLSSFTTGRSEVQKAFLDYFFSSQPVIKMLFGNGYIGTRNIAPTLGLSVETTHMVYLQILLDFGILGFVAYSYIFVKGFFTAGSVQRHILITFYLSMCALSWQFSIPYFGFYLLLFNNKSIEGD